jgi:hypothetical protein
LLTCCGRWLSSAKFSLYLKIRVIGNYLSVIAPDFGAANPVAQQLETVLMRIQTLQLGNHTAASKEFEG